MTTTRTKRITKRQGEQALAAVAEWLGRKGYGGWDEKTNLPTPTPCPTGRDAAYRGLGPELMMDFEGWHGPARPAIVLEGIGGEWAYEAPEALRETFAALGIFAEPAAGYALSLYPADQ